MELNPQYLTFKLLEIGHTAYHRMSYVPGIRERQESICCNHPWMYL